MSPKVLGVLALSCPPKFIWATLSFPVFPNEIGEWDLVKKKGLADGLDRVSLTTYVLNVFPFIVGVCRGHVCRLRHSIKVSTEARRWFLELGLQGVQAARWVLGAELRSFERAASVEPSFPVL